MLKILNGDIYEAFVGEASPFPTLLAQKLPVIISYKLSKLALKLREELKVIEEVRLGLVRKYGEQDEMGNISVKADNPNFSSFVKDFTELMKAEVELPSPPWERVKIPEGVDLQIAPSVLMALDRFIVVE